MHKKSVHMLVEYNLGQPALSVTHKKSTAFSWEDVSWFEVRLFLEQQSKDLAYQIRATFHLEIWRTIIGVCVCPSKKGEDYVTHNPIIGQTLEETLI